LKISNYPTYFIGPQELPIDFVTKMTDGIKLFEDEEDYPFEYLCPEDDNTFVRTNEI